MTIVVTMKKETNSFYPIFQYDHPILEKMDTEFPQRDDLQPSVEPEISKLLSFIIQISAVKSVCELGTSIGYSAISMGLPLKAKGGTLVSVDNHLRTPAEARKNIEIAGLSEVITLVEKDALQFLKEQHNPFDLIFIDCGKAIYPALLPECLRLLNRGGILVADDTLFGIENKVRDSLARPVAQFNEAVSREPALYSMVLPLGHGITLAIKK